MIPVKGFHIEPTNICTLKCAGCARTRFIQQWPAHWQNHNLDISDLLHFLDIDLKGIEVRFCGTYGDPIYHPDFIDMVSEIKKLGAKVSITTNGSHKKQHWWEDLCNKLTPDDRIQFSIDGLPDTFTQYRQNADWDSILVGIETCVKNNVATTWKFIPFRFNESQIQEARSLAAKLNMKDFLLDPSDRYDEKTYELQPVAVELLGKRKSDQTMFDQKQYRLVDAKCYQGREHFISSSGHYIPCCYAADHRFYYKTPFGKRKPMYDIRSTKFSQLVQRSDVVEFYRDIVQTPPKVCQFNCPKD